jgi:predicted esterase
MRRLRLAVALAIAGAIACRSPRDAFESKPSAAPSSSGAATPRAASGPADALPRDAAPEAPVLEPLAADGELVPLPVPGFRDAIVSVPLGAIKKRPVMVALHGNYDRPEWQCEVWREITAGHPFILCPRGIPRAGAPKSADRWEYGGMAKTEQELLAGLDALADRFGKHVDDGPVLFTGFSLGAILGKHILAKHASRFPRAVLTEGGYEGWSAALGKRFRDGGGERVLFACGQSACRQAATGAARVLEKQGVETQVADGGNVGHTYDGRVARAITAEWQFLLGDDPRWRD